MTEPAQKCETIWLLFAKLYAKTVYFFWNGLFLQGGGILNFRFPPKKINSINSWFDSRDWVKAMVIKVRMDVKTKNLFRSSTLRALRFNTDTNSLRNGNLNNGSPDGGPPPVPATTPTTTNRLTYKISPKWRNFAKSGYTDSLIGIN